MAKWEELHKKEQYLLEDERDLSVTTRQLQHLKKDYESHFQQATRYLGRATDLFHQNDSHYLFETLQGDMSDDARKLIYEIEEGEESLISQKRTLIQQLEDVSVAKRQASIAAEEKRYEH